MTGSDDEGVEENIDDLLPFTPEEQELVNELEEAVRNRMLKADPSTLRNVATFLFALKRLPYATPGVCLDLLISDRVNRDLTYVSVEIDGQSFRLSTGGSVYSPDVGSDRFSEVTFELETGGFRKGTTDAFRDWLTTFTSALGKLEVHGEGEVDLTESAPRDGWSRLEAYWDAHGGKRYGW